MATKVSEVLATLSWARKSLKKPFVPSSISSVLMSASQRHVRGMHQPENSTKLHYGRTERRQNARSGWAWGRDKTCPQSLVPELHLEVNHVNDVPELDHERQILVQRGDDALGLVGEFRELKHRRKVDQTLNLLVDLPEVLLLGDGGGVRGLDT
eukprot:834094-Rhodomonas_salina.1